MTLEELMSKFSYVDINITVKEYNGNGDSLFTYYAGEDMYVPYLLQERIVGEVDLLQSGITIWLEDKSYEYN